MSFAMNKPSLPTRRATYQDVIDAPEHMVAEIINGALHTHPRPAPRHSRSSSILGMKVGSPFDLGDGGPGGWIILDEPEIHLGEHVLVPDLAGWRRSTLPRLPDTAFIDTRPDWVCEVLSDSTRTYDLTEKRDIYGAFGVEHIWFVDPTARTLEAFRFKGGAWSLIAALHDDAEVCVAPFDAITFGLAALWDDGAEG